MAPAGVAVSRQDGLLAIELHVPARQSGFVPRPRLVEALSEGLVQGLDPPQGLHLVVSSRADPPLPLARLRARGKLAELRVVEPRFTAEEGRRCWARHRGPGCPVRLRRWWPVPRGGRRGYS